MAVKLTVKAEHDLERSAAMQILYEDLTVAVKVKTKKDGFVTKQILKGVTGIVHPARLTAVMGASGAGKTTFLNVLAGYGMAGAQISGSISVNGEPIHNDRMRDISGFVHQEDVILSTMTVREALTFAAFLRLPGTVSSPEKVQRALDVAEMLNLTKSLDNVVGSALLKGISGGEKRRLSLGMEMITNPSILFLDEPTSGLDTYTAHKVMLILSNVAAKYGRTVCATIHQPSSDIFHLFDDMVVLAEGQLLYQGSAKASVGYFAQLGYVCPTYTNPADYLFMNILNVQRDDDIKHLVVSNTTKVLPDPTNGVKPSGGSGSETNHEAEANRLKGLLQQWGDSKEQQAVMAEMKTGALQTGISSVAVRTSAPMLTQWALLASRAARNAWRNQLIIKAKIGQTIFLSVIVGLIFLNVKNDLSGVQDRQGSMFFLVVQGLFGSVLGVLTIFGAEKSVFKREYLSRMYSLSSYFFSRWLVELPMHIIMPCLSAAIAYWMIGYQNEFNKFCWFALTLVLMDMAGAHLGIFVSCFANNIEAALAVMPMFLLPLMVFSGFFVNSNSIPPYFLWISYLSPMRYGFISLVKNEFQGLDIKCKSGQACPVNFKGEDVIHTLGFDDEGSIGQNAGTLFALSIGFLAFAYLALWYNVRKLSR